MTAAQLSAAAERIYGKRWRPAMAAALRVDIATLRRWTSGSVAVPGPVALAVRLMVEKADNAP